MEAKPHLPGNYTFDWDGRNAGGRILSAGGAGKCAVVSLLSENHIITRGDTVNIGSLKADPSEMHLAYGQFTKIMYSLSRDAMVTVTLISPTGASISLVSSEYQSAGSHVVFDANTPVNLLDGTDAAGKRFVVTEEGVYLVQVQAANPVTGTTSTARGVLKIGF